MVDRRRVIGASPDEWAQFVEARKAGDAKSTKKLKSFFVGKAMQQRGQGRRPARHERIEQRLEA